MQIDVNQSATIPISETGKNSRLRWVLALFAGVLVIASTTIPLRAQNTSRNASNEETPSESVVRISRARSEMKVVERFAKIVELDRKIARVDGFDPEVIDVKGIQGSPNQIRIHALAPGVTTMVLLDENRSSYSIDVFVTGDVRHLQAYIQRLFPHDSVSAVEVRDSVVLRGWVMEPSHITEIVEIAEQFYPRVLNQMKVGGMQQVLLKVKVMEVQRSKIRNLGINWFHVDQNSYLASTPGALTPLSALTVPFGGPAGLTVNAASLTTPTAMAGVVSNNSIFQAFVEALKEEALLKVLAEPQLVTTNGRPSNLLAGGEFPILVPQGLNVTTIEWREFGVRLEAVPIVLGNNRVRLQLQPEVSERDFTNAVDLNGLTVPALTSRRVNTQVEMNFGQTFMIAGLISKRRTAETDKVPFFGELPGVGAAFRRVNYSEGETELVIMVTPELVAPVPPHRLPPGGPGMFTDVPTDRELYGFGMLEVCKFGPECDGCAGCSLAGGMTSRCRYGRCGTSNCDGNCGPTTYAPPRRVQSPAKAPVRAPVRPKLQPQPATTPGKAPALPSIPYEEDVSQSRRTITIPNPYLVGGNSATSSTRVRMVDYSATTSPHGMSPSQSAAWASQNQSSVRSSTTASGRQRVRLGLIEPKPGMISPANNSTASQ